MLVIMLNSICRYSKFGKRKHVESELNDLGDKSKCFEAQLRHLEASKTVDIDVF